MALSRIEVNSLNIWFSVYICIDGQDEIWVDKAKEDIVADKEENGIELCKIYVED